MESIRRLAFSLLLFISLFAAVDAIYHVFVFLVTAAIDEGISKGSFFFIKGLLNLFERSKTFRNFEDTRYFQWMKNCTGGYAKFRGGASMERTKKYLDALRVSHDPQDLLVWDHLEGIHQNPGNQDYYEEAGKMLQVELIKQLLEELGAWVAEQNHKAGMEAVKTVGEKKFVSEYEKWDYDPLSLEYQYGPQHGQAEEVLNKDALKDELGKLEDALERAEKDAGDNKITKLQARLNTFLRLMAVDYSNHFPNIYGMLSVQRI